MWWTWNSTLKKKKIHGWYWTGICLPHLFNCTSEASCLCGHGCSGGIGSGHITELQPNSWEWPLGLTRHAVPMTNTHRATVTCVSHPWVFNPTPTPLQPYQTHTQTNRKSCTVYLMNSTLGAAGVFAGTVREEKTAPGDLWGPSEIINPWPWVPECFGQGRGGKFPTSTISDVNGNSF